MGSILRGAFSIQIILSYTNQSTSFIVYQLVNHIVYQLVNYIVYQLVYDRNFSFIICKSAKEKFKENIKEIYLQMNSQGKNFKLNREKSIHK